MEIEWATAETFRHITVEQFRPILDVLVKIEWPCPDSQIPLIIERLGWVHTRDLVAVEADTRLRLNWARAEFYQFDGHFTLLGFGVSDRVSKDDLAALRLVKNHFNLMIQDMESILGPRSHEDEDDDGLYGVSWDLESGGRIRLDRMSSGLQGRLLSQVLADAERFEETHDMSEFYDDEDE